MAPPDPGIIEEREEERTMKSVKGYVITALVIIMLAVPLTVTVADDTATGAPVTLVGIVNDNFQFAADSGQMYEVEITDVGNELIDTVGQRVELTAVIGEVDDVKTLNVMSFRILEPKPQDD